MTRGKWYLGQPKHVYIWQCQGPYTIKIIDIKDANQTLKYNQAPNTKPTTPPN
jgi:hypothetical protein